MENQNLNESQDSLPSMTDIISSIKENASDVSEYLGSKMDSVSDMSIRDIHQAAVDKTSQGFTNADNNINGAIDSIKGFGNNVADGVMLGVDATKDTYNYVADNTSSAYNSAVNNTSDFYQTVDDTYEGASKGVKSAYASTKETAGEAYDVVAGTISSMPDVTLGEAGKTFVDAKDGAINMASNAYDVTTGTLSSVPDVTLGDVGNTIADGVSYIANESGVVTNAIADQKPIISEQMTDINQQTVDNVAKVSKITSELNVPKGYNVKIIDGVAGIYNNGGERIRYFTPNNAENSGLINKDSIQDWVEKSVKNYEKKMGV